MTPMISASAAKVLHTENTAVFIDCRFSLADHGAGVRDWYRLRIPGARHLHMENDLAGHCTGSNGRHPLPNPVQFEKSLRRVGINAGDTIVLYDDQRLAGAARAWWLMTYFGIRLVRILDGGFRAWRAAGGPVDATIPAATVPTGDIGIKQPNRELVADKHEVIAALKRGRPVVDAREPVRFRGEAEPIDPVAGRIPGATNRPWTDVTTTSGLVYPQAIQRARWRLAPTGQTPVLYCGSGVTASVNALSRVIAGLPPGAVYAGSYSEWCADPQLPIARDKAL